VKQRRLSKAWLRRWERWCDEMEARFAWHYAPGGPFHKEK
jgi:hypothetical protein